MFSYFYTLPLLRNVSFSTAWRLIAILLFLPIFPFVPGTVVAAPAAVTGCDSPYNISSSPGFTSADPLILADPVGAIHLFWAEKVLGAPNQPPHIPDTVMYSSWYGHFWSDPVDIFISPPENFNRRIMGVQGDIDESGRIHLVWIGPDGMFFYGSAHAAEAGNAQTWYGPILLAHDQTGTQYSVDIRYQAPDTLHVIYGRDPEYGVNRAVTVIRSHDNGLTWSQPVDIHFFTDLERGASNTRLHTNPFFEEHVYATWTEWDQTGNGQVVYFARSLDAGRNWEQPIPLAVRVDNEYQRDWTNLAVLDENTLVVFWSGGFRAYPQAQYSYDGGVTWGEPIDTLYWLIADNGFAQFVQDNEGRTHLFIARRIREGHGHRCTALPGCRDEGNAIWHSTWQGDTAWSEPQPVGGFRNANYITMAYDGGNQLFFSWFRYTDTEIYTMRCQIEDATSREIYPWPTITPMATSTTTPALLLHDSFITQSIDTPAANDLMFLPAANTNPGSILIFSLLPSLTIIILIVFWKTKK